uniref:ShKT domain-containing protein n=1 Tax=Elaeophora elaphi TaxID=1147741 RepID=A0A0R3RTS4_9BILA
MIKSIAPVLFWSFVVVSAWNRWNHVPFEFKYERRPDWCVDEDPLCSTLKSWCITANKTRENYMKKACRRTCHVCYEGMNNTKTCRDKESDCAQREIECFSEATAERMHHLCPETCGFCNNVCADLATNCDELTDYCTFSYWHQAVMQSRCLYDRENFEPVDCSDNLSYCRYMRHLCERIEHQKTMNEDCPYTCNFCDYIETVADIPIQCNDAEIDCPSKIHLCYVEGRHSYHMWRNCKRTCGYCPEYNFNDTSTDDTYDPNYYY